MTPVIRKTASHYSIAYIALCSLCLVEWDDWSICVIPGIRGEIRKTEHMVLDQIEVGGRSFLENCKK